MVRGSLYAIKRSCLTAEKRLLNVGSPGERLSRLLFHAGVASEGWSDIERL